MKSLPDLAVCSYVEVSRSQAKKAIPLKWVLTVKYKEMARSKGLIPSLQFKGFSWFPA
jgi:hypothetical protein